MCLPPCLALVVDFTTSKKFYYSLKVILFAYVGFLCRLSSNAVWVFLAFILFYLVCLTNFTSVVLFRFGGEVSAGIEPMASHMRG